MTPNIESLIANYRDGVGQLSEAVVPFTDQELDAVPIPGLWSVRQVVCHISDFEIVAADRLKRVLAEDNPSLANGDPDAFAKSLSYRQRNVNCELNVISAIRLSTATILDQCDLEDFQRTGVHSLDGPMTLEGLLERTISHIPHHIRFIEEKLAALRAS